MSVIFRGSRQYNNFIENCIVALITRGKASVYTTMQVVDITERLGADNIKVVKDDSVRHGTPYTIFYKKANQE